LITPAEITAGTNVTVLSSTTAGHAHYVSVTAADFTALRAGKQVLKKSCAGADHEWLLTCASTGLLPGTPTCSDECGDGTTPADACL
jgi:hypothetical protein